MLSKLYGFLKSKILRKSIIPKELFKKYLPDNPCIIESGAYKGEDTIELSRIFPNSTIHAFEPVPHIYETLTQNTSNCGNVITYNLALNDKTGIKKMYLSGGTFDGSSSLLKPKEHIQFHPKVIFDREIEVKTISLDDWARNYNIDKVDFMWLDMQGVEYVTLKASNKIFNTVRLLYTEVSLIETYQDVPLYDKFKQWLENKGFSVIKEELPWKDMGNVLFARTK